MNQGTMRFFLAGSLLAMCAFVYAVVAANRGVSADELQRIQVEQRQLAQCLLLELEAHRMNSSSADRADSLHHRYNLDLPAPLPGDMSALPPDACAPFLE